MRLLLAILCVHAAAGRAAPANSALRAFCADGERVWAVGDAGIILLSADGGQTWAEFRQAEADSFQSAFVAGPSVSFVGGRGLAGHPRGVGRGVVFRTDDGGKTFRKLPAPPVGWLYGGIAYETAGALFGEASRGAPNGLWRTVTDGRIWKPIDLAKRAEAPLPMQRERSPIPLHRDWSLDWRGRYLLAGDFRTFRKGYLVGGRHRVVSLRNLAEPAVRPPAIETDADLRAAAFADEDECWAVGENGTVLRSRAGGQTWNQLDLKLPAGTRRLADFEAIAFAAPKEAYVAGGLVGAIFHTTDAGATWERLPAPAPGPIHALACLAGGKLLAAGDAGRIWRSTDGGKTFKLVRGPEHTDVLFVLSPADRSLYPAIVTHAQAGCTVAVLYVARAAHLDGVPPDQPLRAAAIRAGAGGAVALSDFDSQALTPAADALTAKDVLDGWKRRIDQPAEPEMTRQIAAAIRLYRPKVVAFACDATRATGPAAECRLAAMLASKAADDAGKADAWAEQAAVGLQPHRPERVFRGAEANDEWRPVWAPAAAPGPMNEDRKPPTTLIDAAVFPQDAPSSVEMIALQALSRLPWFALADRPNRFTAFDCWALHGRRMPLFTAGLSPANLIRRAVDGDLALAAAGAQLKFAAATKDVPSAVAQLTKLAESCPDDPLPPDRIALAWLLLCAEGLPRSLHQAGAAHAAFRRLSRPHPYSGLMSLLGMSAALSCEWRVRLLGAAPQAIDAATLKRDLKSFEESIAWSDAPEALLLRARAWAAFGQAGRAREILQQLAQCPEVEWGRCALLELGLLDPEQRPFELRRMVAAAAAPGTGRIDGRLDEPFWSRTPRVDLVSGRGPRPEPDQAGSFRVIRTATHLVLGVRLACPDEQDWQLAVAIDADRDAWTQVVFRCDTAARDRTAELRQRYGPAALVPSRPFHLQARKQRGECTFEIAVPFAELRVPMPESDLWYFQLRATMRQGKTAQGETDPPRRIAPATLFFQPQADDRLEPHRYGLLQIAPMPRAQSRLQSRCNGIGDLSRCDGIGDLSRGNEMGDLPAPRPVPTERPRRRRPVPPSRRPP